MKTQTDLLQQWYLDTKDLPVGEWDLPDIIYGMPLQQDLVQAPYTHVSKDLSTVWNKALAIREDQTNKFNQSSAKITALQSQMQAALAKTEIAALSSDTDSRFLFVGDSFNSYAHLLPSSTALVSGGLLTLATSADTAVNSAISGFTIDQANSVGSPGTNSCIALVTEAALDPKNKGGAEPTVTLESSTNNRALLSTILSPAPDSWFEWEQVYMPPIQPLKSEGSTYVYSPGAKKEDVRLVTKSKDWGWRMSIQWPGEATLSNGPDGKGYPIVNWDNAVPAKVGLNITLATSIPVSHLTLTPRALGGLLPIIESLSISEDGSLWQKVLSNKSTFMGGNILTLPGKTISHIKLILKVDKRYTPSLGLGHAYVVQKKQITNTNSGFFGIGSSSNTRIEYTREPNPQTGMVVGTAAPPLNTANLLSTAGSSIGSIFGGPIGSAIGGFAGTVIGAITDGLFSSKTSTQLLGVENHYDIFTGTRSAIGIESFVLGRRTYVADSQALSRAWEFTKPLNQVVIVSQDTTPSTWPAGNYIKYSLSTDGVTWTDVIPQGKTGSQPFAANGATKIWVRIQLSRPTNDDSSTPVISNYALKALPQ